jgi:LysM repeat protein
MQAVRQLGGGLFYGLISTLLVVGGLSLAFAETMVPAQLTPTSVLPAIPQTLTPTRSGPTQVPTSTPLPTETPLPPTNCPPPNGWVRISVAPGDTLENLAARYNTTAAQIAQANCLLTSSLVVGYGIYVPYIPPTVTFIPCGPFPGWVLGYTVQPFDTLYHIATLYGTSVFDMQRANCIPVASRIFAGQQLWVPNVPTITPGITIIPEFSTPTDVPTEPLTLTPLPYTATIEPTEAEIPNTQTSVPPTATITAFPTATPTQ